MPLQIEFTLEGSPWMEARGLLKNTAQLPWYVEMESVNMPGK